MIDTDSRRKTILETQGEVIGLHEHDGGQISMRIYCPDIAEKALPGQFIHIRCSNWLQMRRPMSIMRASENGGWLEILFKKTGVGTEALSLCKPGESLKILGPIGNSFRLNNYLKHVILIGGGVGIPPLLFLAEHIKRINRNSSIIVFMGSEVPFPFKLTPSKIYVGSELGQAIASIPFLEDLGVPSRLASNQGFAGCYFGHVTNLASEYLRKLPCEKEEIEIFACGPNPMLIEAQKVAKAYAHRSQISVEENMACAVGGCAGCTIAIQSESDITMKRVCVDGPIFDGTSVIFS